MLNCSGKVCVLQQSEPAILQVLCVLCTGQADIMEEGFVSMFKEVQTIQNEDSNEHCGTELELGMSECTQF